MRRRAVVRGLALVHAASLAGGCAWVAGFGDEPLPEVSSDSAVPSPDGPRADEGGDAHEGGPDTGPVGPSDADAGPSDAPADAADADADAQGDTSQPREGSVPVGAAGSIATGVQDGELRVIYVPEDGVIRVDTLEPDASWSGAVSIGSVTPGAHVATGVLGGQLEVFVVQADGSVAMIPATPSGASDSGVTVLTPPRVVPTAAWLATALEDDSLDLFYVDYHGVLMVQRAPADGGAWSAATAISAPGFAVPGSDIVGGNFKCGPPTAFVVDANGVLQSFSLLGSGACGDAGDAGDARDSGEGPSGAADAGDWQGPTPVSAPGWHAPPGAPLTLLIQNDVGMDLFAVDETGVVTLFWSVAGGAWTPSPLSNPGFVPAGAPSTGGDQATDQLDLLTIDSHGTLGAFFESGGGSWTTPVPVNISQADAAMAAGPIASAVQGGRMYAFLATPDGALVTYSVHGNHAGWDGPTPLP